MLQRALRRCTWPGLALLGLALLLPRPAPAAQIEGRVVHARDNRPLAGVTVLALGLDADENPLRLEAVTDAEGRFRIEDAPAPAAYLLRAIHEDHPYPGPTVIFRPDEPPTHPPLEITVFERSASAEDLEVASVQWILSYEAGAFEVQHVVAIANRGQRVVQAPPEAEPLLRVGLAAGHGEVEAPFGRLPPGATVNGDVVEIRGPVFPGGDGLRLQMIYELPGESGALSTRLPFPDGAEDLAVYVRDYGVRVDTAGELHPARAARQDDVFYLSFVGFEIPAGHTVPIEVQPLPPRAATPRGVAVAAAAGLAGLLVWLVGAPVTRESRVAEEPAGDVESDAVARLRQALADLDHDHETGKLSDEDRERLREELRREAALELARERGLLASAATSAGAPATAEGPTTESAKRCSCGRAAAPDDRFCAACGKAL